MHEFVLGRRRFESGMLKKALFRDKLLKLNTKGEVKKCTF